MSPCRLVTASAMIVAFALAPSIGRAMGGPQQGTGTTEDGYRIVYERPGGHTTGGGGARVDCRYRLQPIVAGSGDGSAEASLYESQGVEELGPGGVAYRTDPQTGAAHRHQGDEGQDHGNGTPNVCAMILWPIRAG